MKKLATFILIASSMAAMAQKKDKDDIVYYEDATVKHSRFGIALNANPVFTDRRLINNEVPENGAEYFLPSPRAEGAFQLNYGLDLIYSIGSSLDFSIGFSHGSLDYTVDDVQFYYPSLDTVKGTLKGSASWYGIPLKFNFNTSVNDIWDLEVVPMVQFNIPYNYELTFSPEGNNFDDAKIDGSDRLNNLTYIVGLSLGGTYKFADNWGLIIRGNVGYMLNALIEQENYPRETTLSYGLDLGLKYSF